MSRARIAALTTLAMLAFAGNSLLCRAALKHTRIDPASVTSIRLVSGADALAVGACQTQHLPENAACEGFFGRLKTELFYPRNWQATTIEQFIQMVDAYIR